MKESEEPQLSQQTAGTRTSQRGALISDVDMCHQADRCPLDHQRAATKAAATLSCSCRHNERWRRFLLRLAAPARSGPTVGVQRKGSPRTKHACNRDLRRLVVVVEGVGGGVEKGWSGVFGWSGVAGVGWDGVGV